MGKVAGARSGGSSVRGERMASWLSRYTQARTLRNWVGCSPFHQNDLIGHPSGAGTGEPPSSYGSGGSFHQFRSPFWKGGGRFLAGRSASRMERGNAASAVVDFA